MTSGGGDDTAGTAGVQMLHDRLLVDASGEAGERRSGGGIVIPATATVGRRLAWATVMAIGPHVRQVGVGNRVLFDPEDRAEVEIQGRAFVLLRERDLHAVGRGEHGDARTGLYL